MSSTILFEDEYFCLQCECNTGTWFVHLSVRKDWTPSRCKELRVIWETVKADFKENNITELYTLVDNEDEKLNKFLRMWGFKALVTFSNAVLYRQEI